MPSIAVVGASADRKKYGNKAVRAFLQGGWTVYPVNPGAGKIEGLDACASVGEIPEALDRVSMYVPPAVGLAMLPAIASRRPRGFYLNPGSESPELIAAARALGLEPIMACSIVNIGMRPEMFPDA